MGGQLDNIIIKRISAMKASPASELTVTINSHRKKSSDNRMEAPDDEEIRQPLIPHSNNTNSENNNAKQGKPSEFHRWILRENLIWSLFERITLLHSKKNLINNLPLPDAYSQKDEKTLRTLKVLHIIRSALDDFAGRLWPTLLLILFLSDAISYGVYSSRRYFTDDEDLFSGFYRNHWASLGAWDDGFPNAASFWLLPGFLLVMPLLMIAIEMVSFKLTNQEKSIEILKELKDRETSGDNKNKISLVRKLFYSLFPYSIYRQTLNHAVFYIGRSQLNQIEKSAFETQISALASEDNFLMALPAMSTLAVISSRPKEYEDASIGSTNFKKPVPVVFWGRQSLVRIFNSEDKLLTENKGIKKSESWRQSAANYFLWTLGEKVSKKTYVLSSFLTLIRWSYLYYSTYRYFQILYTRGQQAYQFFTNQAQCKTVWDYSSVTGEYECTPCGNWTFVPAQLTYNAQACLNALLETTLPNQDWNRLLNGLDLLSHHPDGINQFSLATANIATWNSSLTQQVLNAIGKIRQDWLVGNFSTIEINNIWFNTDSLNTIANFLNVNSFYSVDFTNLNLGLNNWIDLLNQWNAPKNLNQITIVGNNLPSEGMYVLSNWVMQHNITLNLLNIAENPVGNLGVKAIFNQQMNQIKVFIVSDTSLTGGIFDALLNWLPNSTVSWFDFSLNDCTGGNYTILAQAISDTPTLTHFNGANIRMGDPDLINLALFWQNNTISLNTFIGNNNFVTGVGVAQFGLLTKNTPISIVDWGFNPIDDLSLPALQTVLSELNWVDLNLSGILASETSIANFWQYLTNSTVHYIRLTNMSLESTALYPVPILLKQNLTLNGIDVSGNQLGNFAQDIVDSACRAGVREINVANNRISNFLSNIDTNTFLTYRCIKIDTSENPHNDNSISNFVIHLQNMTLQSFILNNVPISSTSAINIAKQLIKNIPNPDDLEDPNPGYRYDEARALNQSKPATQLGLISLQGCNISNEGYRALRRVGAHLPNLDMLIPYTNENSDFGNSQISCANKLAPSFFQMNLNSNNQASVTLVLAAVPLVNVFLMLFFICRILNAGLKYVNKNSFWSNKTVLITKVVSEQQTEQKTISFK